MGKHKLQTRGQKRRTGLTIKRLELVLSAVSAVKNENKDPKQFKEAASQNVGAAELFKLESSLISAHGNKS